MVDRLMPHELAWITIWDELRRLAKSGTVERMRRLRSLTIAIAVAMATTSSSSAEGIYVEGLLDCGRWLDGRKQNASIAIEHYLVGLLNGLSLSSGVEFWRAGGVSIGREQVYYWMDNFCRADPLSTVVRGSIELINQRTVGAYANARQTEK